MLGIEKINLWTGANSKIMAEKLTNSLQNIGFEKCLLDNCLTMRVNRYGRVILCIYIDNVCCIGDKNAVEKIITKIEILYKIKQFGNISEFIGVNICIKNETLFLLKKIH